MKRLATLLATLSVVGFAHAGLKHGDSPTPYEVKNVETNKEYRQACACARKGVDVVAFGKLKDEKFWGKLKIIQKMWTRNNKLRAIAQIIDSEDVNAIKAAAEEHGITFPVIVAKQKEWDNAYRKGGRIVFTIRPAHICWRE